MFLPLAIKKLSETSSVQQLVSIYKDTHQTPHIDDPNYGINNSHGIIDLTHRSFLTVEWLNPKLSESGTYQCKANVFNQVDDIFVFFENKTVSFTQASMSSVIQRLRELETAINKKLNTLESALFKKSSVFNGHQYYLSLYQPQSAANAEMVCKALGGYLAEIDSKNEFDFLTNVIGNPFADHIAILLGGTDEGHEGHWVSRRTGVPLTYLPWPQGLPDNVLYRGLTENCQFMEYKLMNNSFIFNDFFCFNSDDYYSYYFMCEVPL